MTSSIAILGTKTTCLRLIHALGTQLSLIVTVDDESDTRSELTAILAAGRQFGVPVQIATGPVQAYGLLLESQATVVLVAGWYQMIPPKVLDAVPHGFVGLHYSKLPSYRGWSPVVWALINGEAEVGYSIFRMTPGVDDGPLAAQGTVSVGDRDVGEMLDLLDEASLRELSRIAKRLADGTQLFTEQPTMGISYAGARTPSDGRIEWGLTATALERQVRAQSRPYPGAFTHFDGQTVKVWKAHTEGYTYYGTPGQVVRLIDGTPVVACGDGTGLVLEEIESMMPIRFSLLSSRFGT